MQSEAISFFQLNYGRCFERLLTKRPRLFSS